MDNKILYPWQLSVKFCIITIVVQIYMFAELYLLFASAVMLSDRYGARILILFNVKSYYESKPVVKVLAFILGLFLLLCLCMIPMSPGPAFIGDLLPETAIVAILFCIVSKKSTSKLGFFVLTVALLHMIAPSLVII